jgi:hypothetical protein
MRVGGSSYLVVLYFTLDLSEFVISLEIFLFTNAGASVLYSMNSL